MTLFHELVFIKSAGVTASLLLNDTFHLKGIVT